MTHRESGQTDGIKSTNLTHINDNVIIKEKNGKPRASFGNTSCTKMSLLTRRISKQDMNGEKKSINLNNFGNFQKKKKMESQLCWWQWSPDFYFLICWHFLTTFWNLLENFRHLTHF